MNGEFRLNLKAFGEDWESLYEGARHGPVAGHDIVEGITIDPANHCADEVVTKAMKGAFVLLCVGTVRESIAHGHIRFTREDWGGERCGSFRRIGVIPIDHEVAICVNIAEHLPHDVALALPGFVANDCARFLRKFCGFIA